MTYLLVGHVTQDVLPGGTSRLGGTVVFAALALAERGEVVSVVTACTETTEQQLRARLGQDVEVDVVRSGDTRFGFEGGAGFGPTHLLSTAAVLEELPAAAAGSIAVVHLAPVAGELSLAICQEARRQGRWVGLTPQGIMRRTDADGKLRLGAPTPSLADIAPDAAIVNDEEFEHLDSSGGLDGYHGLLFRTLGREGAVVYQDGVELARAAPRAASPGEVADTIGAGDVFSGVCFQSLAAGVAVPEALDAAIDAATTFVTSP